MPNKKLHLSKLGFKKFPNPEYYLADIPLNNLVGKKISLEFLSQINCVECGNLINKSFNQGHCYPCFMSKAACDMCIMKPELCHYAAGTCREPSWGEGYCLKDHTIYLANSSQLKVGITRSNQKETRWVDQGAVQAVEIARVDERLHSGLVEVALKEYYSDRANWRKLITGDITEIDLLTEAKEAQSKLSKLKVDFEIELPELKESKITYPVEAYPAKAKVFNFDKTPRAVGVLMGIRGQYLLFEDFALNIRKFQGYFVSFSY